MHREAVRLGHLIVEKEAALEERFAEQTIDEADLWDMVLKVEALKGTMRFTHLRAHLAVKDILTPGQIARHDALRGTRVRRSSTVTMLIERNGPGEL